MQQQIAQLAGHVHRLSLDDEMHSSRQRAATVETPSETGTQRGGTLGGREGTRKACAVGQLSS